MGGGIAHTVTAAAKMRRTDTFIDESNEQDNTDRQHIQEGEF